MTVAKTQLQHPSKTAPSINTSAYEAYRDALLAVIPADENGIAFKDLSAAAEAFAPNLNQHGSVGWYTTTVKLHLEAIGIIERVPKSRPQRVRLVKRG